MQATQRQTRNTGFPRLGKASGRFFHRLEKLTWTVSKAWKVSAACALACGLAPWSGRADLFDQPEYKTVETEPAERFNATPAEEEAALRRREVDISNSARSELLSALTDFKAGRWDESIQKLEALIEADPTTLPAWDLLGNAYWRAGRGNEAITLWNKLRTIRPDYPPVYQWLGRAYMLSNDLASARNIYAKGLQMGPALLGADLNYARVLRWSGNLEESARILRPLAAAQSNRLDIVRELASALLSNREFEEALPLWQKLLASDPTNLLFKAKTAVALLHTGQPAEAITAAGEVLAADAAQMDALGVMADHAQFQSATPLNALPILLQMIALTEKPARQRQLTLRYVNLYGRLQGDDPSAYPMERPAGLLRRLVEKDPFDADVRLALGETLVICQHYPAAREQFSWVLEHLNPNNIRALRNLFELDLVDDKHRDAEEHLQRMLAFNPRDPYRHYFLARWYIDQGKYSKALEEVDLLESEGSQGAVAVLLYHGLSSSDSGEVLPARRLADHLKELRAAGFRFVTANELPDALKRDAANSAGRRNAPIDRQVCITFDDARRDSMRYGTPIAKECQVRFSMHVPVGYVENKHPFICTWDMLRNYQKGGGWIFGGHTYFAHDRTAIDAQGRLGFALPNHLWLPAAGRLETNEEYAQRLDHEYTACQRALAKELGHGEQCTFFAYPFGDIGQLTRSNDPEAPHKNLAHCAQAFPIGFIQTYFGYAMATDNPLLFQRFEPDRLDDGAAVVRRVLENHPVNMARMLRTEIAALSDKRYLLQETLALLMRDGYPEASVNKLHDKLQRMLGRKFPLPSLDHAPAVVEGPAPLPAVPTAPVPTTRELAPAAPTPGTTPQQPVLANADPIAPTNTLPRRKSGGSLEAPADRGGLRDFRNPLR